MQVQPSEVPDIELIGPEMPPFRAAIEQLLGRPPDEFIEPALPYSVIARNCGLRAVHLLGIRFNMVGPKGKPYSTVHFSDTLRHPDKPGLTANGGMRFVCAEPFYTSLVLQRERQTNKRAQLNLATLSKAARMVASVDCLAFDDGQFLGPDSRETFDRLRSQRKAEIAFLKEILKPGCPIAKSLRKALEAPSISPDRAAMARRALAKKLFDRYGLEGRDAAVELARNYPLKIRLWRDDPME